MRNAENREEFNNEKIKIKMKNNCREFLKDKVTFTNENSWT